MRKIFKPFKSSKVLVTGMIVSLCFAFVGCSKAEQNKGSRSFTDFTHIEEEYLATLKNLDSPEGTVLPERLEGEDSEAYFQEGYGENERLQSVGIFVDAGVDGYLYNRARTCRAGIKGTGKSI